MVPDKYIYFYCLDIELWKKVTVTALLFSKHSLICRTRVVNWGVWFTDLWSLLIKDLSQTFAQKKQETKQKSETNNWWIVDWNVKNGSVE